MLRQQSRHGLAILAIASPLPASASTGFEPQQSAMQWVAGIECGLRCGLTA